MSWMLQYPDGVRGDHSWKDLNSRELDNDFGFGDLSEEVLEQVAQAKVMANSVIVSGVIGDINKKFNVNLSGHANHNHEPKEGWANDMITISVSQRKEE